MCSEEWDGDYVDNDGEFDRDLAKAEELTSLISDL